MKTTPIYILLLIFFLNFDLAWGTLVDVKQTPHLVQSMYSLNNSDNEYFHSLNVALFLNSEQYLITFRKKDIIPLHRLRLNIGLSKVLTELDYDFGLDLKISKQIDIMPYVTLGTNIYSVGYGGGIDINISTKSRFFITGNLNYRTIEKLFGHTDAQQWYQSGFGAKIGVGFIISTYEDPPVNFYQYDDY